MTISMGHQLKVLITVVLMLAVLGGGWLLGIQPALESALAAQDSREQVRAQNDGMRASLVALAAAKEELPALEGRLATLNDSIPTTDDSSALIDDIDELARAAGVTVESVTIEDAQPYVPPQPAAQTAETATADAAATTTEAAAPNPLAPATDPRITAGNFVLVPVNVAVSGSFGEVLDFVEGVQSGSRLFLVNKLTSATDAEGDGATVKANVGGYVYALLDAKS